ARFLTDQGYRVEAVSDGLECVAQMRRFRPDVLILDRNLLWGGSDGVLAQLREASDLPTMAVILTSTSDFGDADLTSPPVVARLLKPFRLTALLEAISAARARLKVCELS